MPVILFIIMFAIVAFVFDITTAFIVSGVLVGLWLVTLLVLLIMRAVISRKL